MARRFAVVLAGAIAAISIAGAAPALSLMDVNLEGTTLYVNAHPPVDAEKVKIVVLAPQKDGTGREVFKRCVFSGTGATTYRCPIDVSPGSAALKRAGSWASKLVVDGDKIARITFDVGL